MISHLIRIELELEESMHLDCILRQDEFSVILDGQLLQSKKTEVRENLVHHDVISVSADWMSFEKHCGKNL
jgi:hypothetical protein